ncbi:MAG: hypothetical protein R3A50_09780 [Saprospiraceae bacterium]
MRLNTVHIILVCLFTFLSFTMKPQSWDGVYSDGVSYLTMEEVDKSVVGIFIDAEHKEYKVNLQFTEKGLYGYLGSFYAYIPYDTEKLKLYITTADADKNPLWDKASIFELDYYSDLNGATQDESFEYNWSPIHQFGQDFYPSFVLATSTMTNEINFETDDQQYGYYGDRNGYFGVQVEGIPAGSTVTVVIEGAPFINPSTYEVILTQPGINEIYPVLEYDFNALKSIDQAQPVNVKYALYLNGQLLDTKLEVVWTRSVNDAVTYARDHHGNEYNFEFMFAAYVNENEPGLDPILGQILGEGAVDSWTGYQGTTEDVLKQVFALWYHFQRKGFRYSDISTQSGTDDMSFGQTVRFVKDAINSSQANCIDGTVLFASFLYKIGINVSIVMVPGHAYLAFLGDEGGNAKYALETTMMGSLSQAQSQGRASANLDITSSSNSFQAALGEGTKNYMEAYPHIQQNEPRYMEINIGEARSNKVRPIK